jgi:hypothetical protein
MKNEMINCRNILQRMAAGTALDVTFSAPVAGGGQEYGGELIKLPEWSLQ